MISSDPASNLQDVFETQLTCNEIEWINKVDAHSNGKFAVIPWSSDEIKGARLAEFIK